MKQPKLPQHVYVKWERDRNADASYLIADETTEDMDDGDRVGVYVLQETKTIRVTRRLQ